VENKITPATEKIIFATHVSMRMLTMKNENPFLKSLTYRMLFIFTLFALSVPAFAQYEDDYDDQGKDDYYEDDYNNEDSSYEDDGYDDYDSYDDYGDDGYDDYGSGSSPTNGIELKNGGKVGKPIEKKTYVRFQPPVDTITRLITYLEIVEVKDQEGFESYSDSLFTRAQRWLDKNYSKKELKDYLKQSGMNTKGEGYIIEMEGQFPLMMKPNDFTTVENGRVEFAMELRFKDGRYRYKINNLVHVQPPMYGEKDEIRTYMEYYTKTKRDIESTDKILLAADEHIQKMIKSLKDECKEPIFVDEDDW
jgi:hypothetical protein